MRSASGGALGASCSGLGTRRAYDRGPSLANLTIGLWYSGQEVMGESKGPRESRPEEIIAAFDRQRDIARELNRRHTEHVRNSRADDRPADAEHRHHPQ